MEQLALTARDSIWKNRNFVVLITTAFLINFGSRVYELALPLIIYELTQSSIAMGTMRAVEFLPNLLLAMAVGVFVDRGNKKQWMVTTVIIQIVILGVLYTLIQLNQIEQWIFYITGFLLMLCQYGHSNARTSSVKWALPNRMLTSANAKFTFIRTLMEVMGPAISGAILFLSSLYYGLLITAVLYLCALLILSQLELNEKTVQKSSGTFLQDLKAGWENLKSNRSLMVLTWFVVFFNSTTGMFEVMVIFFVKDELQWSTALVGAVLSLAGVGGLLGSMVVERLRNALGIGKTIALCVIAQAPTYALIVFFPNEYMVGTSLFLFGFFTTIQSVCIWSFRHETTPAPLIGRVSGITGSIFKLGMPLAIFGSGYITEFSGASTIFMICAIAQLFLFTGFLISPMYREQ